MDGPRGRNDVDLTLKLCLAGDYRVGKTSLVRRFVTDAFDEGYVSTLGAKVASRKFAIEDPDAHGAPIRVGASIWDIMGNVGFREMLKDAYFFNARGVLLVADATRPSTLQSLESWYNAVVSIAGNVPAVVLLSKADLAGERKVGDEDVDRVCAPLGWPWLRASARTGENVERAFGLLADLCLRAVRTGNLAAPKS